MVLQQQRFLLAALVVPMEAALLLEWLCPQQFLPVLQALLAAILLVFQKVIQQALVPVQAQEQELPQVQALKQAQVPEKEQGSVLAQGCARAREQALLQEQVLELASERVPERELL